MHSSVARPALIKQQDSSMTITSKSGRNNILICTVVRNREEGDFVFCRWVRFGGCLYLYSLVDGLKRGTGLFSIIERRTGNICKGNDFMNIHLPL